MSAGAPGAGPSPVRHRVAQVAFSTPRGLTWRAMQCGAVFSSGKSREQGESCRCEIASFEEHRASGCTWTVGRAPGEQR